MSTDHLEFDEVLPMLSVPAEQHDRHSVSRRRFLQGVLAAGVATSLPLVRAQRAEAATPIGPGDGVLVVVFLGGGNDTLNMLAPIDGPARGHYNRLRGAVGVPAGQLRAVGEGWGLHPAMGNVHRSFRAGRVALVRGSGLPLEDLSHFTATAKMMQGSTTATGNGWLGRFLDGVSESESGMRGLSVSTSVPMHLLGRRAKITAVPSDGAIWGANRSAPGEGALIDAVTSIGEGPTGLPGWGDRLAQNGSSAIATAARVERLVQGGPPASGLVRDLALAARLINANVGARVVAVTLGGWDTHIAQNAFHGQLLGELDAAIGTFFNALSNGVRNRTTMLVQSEFGRRPDANAGIGTDHGNASVQMLIGPGVRGGLHGEQPALDRLDERGNLRTTVDFRAVYSQILDRWLGGDAREVLGGHHGGLDLFQAAPSSA